MGIFYCYVSWPEGTFFLLQLNCSNCCFSQRGLVLLLPLAIGWDCLTITSQSHGESESTHSGIAGRTHAHTLIIPTVFNHVFLGDRSIITHTRHEFDYTSRNHEWSSWCFWVNLRGWWCQRFHTFCIFTHISGTFNAHSTELFQCFKTTTFRPEGTHIISHKHFVV